MGISTHALDKFPKVARTNTAIHRATIPVPTDCLGECENSITDLAVSTDVVLRDIVLMNTMRQSVLKAYYHIFITFGSVF